MSAWQGWLGSKDAVLASGEGAIQVARWSGTLVAWADEAGVKVYDTAVHQHFAFLERPRHTYAPYLASSAGIIRGDIPECISATSHAGMAGRLQPGAPGCRLFWEGEERLYVAWGDTVRVGRLAPAPRGTGSAGAEPRRALEVVASLHMECLVAVRCLACMRINNTSPSTSSYYTVPTCMLLWHAH